MADEPSDAQSSAYLSDLLVDRIREPGSVSDDEVRESIEVRLRAHFSAGPKPWPERIVGVELETLKEEPGKLELEGWVVLEGPDAPHVRRPILVGFSANGEGVVRVASAASDRPLDADPVRRSELDGAWQAALFIGRPRN